MRRFSPICLLIPVFIYSLISLQEHDHDLQAEDPHSVCDLNEGFSEEESSLLQVELSPDKPIGESASAGFHTPLGQSLLQKRRSLARAKAGGSKDQREADPDLLHTADTVQSAGKVNIQPTGMSDWLYTASPGSCTKAIWDNDQYSDVSRTFLPFIFLILCAFTVLYGRSTDDESAGLEDSPAANASEGGRRYDLDFARIVCVAAVVSEHSGGTHWTEQNVMFVLQWVLPFLYITSAISWMRSKKDCLAFVGRLAVVLVVGVSANWVADLIKGRDWRHDFGNTVFQMFYVVMLIVLSTMSAPLKYALYWRRANPDKPAFKLGSLFWFALVLYGAITLVAFIGFIYQSKDRSVFTFDSNSWFGNQVGPVIVNAPIAAIQICGAFFLAHLACVFKANDVFPWVLLLHIYLPRFFIPWEQVGFFHNFELFVFGMVYEAWKLQGQKKIQTWVMNYWPLMVFVMMFATMPDMYGRCDLVPPTTVLERCRFYGIELILVLVLSVGAIKVGDPYRMTEWLGYWALYAYCFHVAWARLLPIPYGAAFTYASAGVVYLAWRPSAGSGLMNKDGSPKDDSKDNPKGDSRDSQSKDNPKVGPDFAGGG